MPIVVSSRYRVTWAAAEPVSRRNCRRREEQKGRKDRRTDRIADRAPPVLSENLQQRPTVHERVTESPRSCHTTAGGHPDRNPC